MEIRTGAVVRSRAGHDKGDLLFVCGFSDGMALVIDGKSRRPEKPKRKNLRHLAVVAEQVPGISERMAAGEKVLAAEIRKTLSAMAEGEQE